MINLTTLPTTSIQALTDGYENGIGKDFRRRCQAILLLIKGHSVKNIFPLLQIKRKGTIYGWIRQYNSLGIKGLVNKQGRGRKSALVLHGQAAIDIIKKALGDAPQGIRGVTDDIGKGLGLEITYCMLRKHLRDVMGFSYKRLRKWLTPLRDEKEYGKLREELMVLLRREAAGEIKVFFGDESGFCLDPSVPYGWGEKGKTGCILARKSGRCNVFGLLSTDNTFDCWTIAGKLDASFVVACLDEFAGRLNNEKTVVVIDNASVHKAREVQEKREGWEKKGLTIWYLPTYSPHLNKIETLWRKIKYEWLKPKDYMDLETLEKALDNILINIGQKKYNIQFNKSYV